MSKHTPGPWTAHVPYPATNPRYAVTASYPNGLTFEVAVASMGDWSMAEARANATLIAAAPELLEALADMVATASEVEHIMDGDKEKQAAWSEELGRLYVAIDAARAIIAKATGEHNSAMEKKTYAVRLVLNKYYEATAIVEAENEKEARELALASSDTIDQWDETDQEVEVSEGDDAVKEQD